MQTFLPHRSFRRSVEVLDWKRLGKQRVECKQLLNALLRPETAKGWKNHPAAKMWKGHELPLCRYAIKVCEEWRTRGYKDEQLQYFNALYKELKLKGYKYILPDWLGKKRFHASHRSNLLRKDQEHYGQFGWKEGPDLPYHWPVN